MNHNAETGDILYDEAGHPRLHENGRIEETIEVMLHAGNGFPPGMPRGKSIESFIQFVSRITANIDNPRFDIVSGAKGRALVIKGWRDITEKEKHMLAEQTRQREERRREYEEERKQNRKKRLHNLAEKYADEIEKILSEQ